MGVADSTIALSVLTTKPITAGRYTTQASAQQVCGVKPESPVLAHLASLSTDHLDSVATIKHLATEYLSRVEVTKLMGKVVADPYVPSVVNNLLTGGTDRNSDIKEETASASTQGVARDGIAAAAPGRARSRSPPRGLGMREYPAVGTPRRGKRSKSDLDLDSELTSTRAPRTSRAAASPCSGAGRVANRAGGSDKGEVRETPVQARSSKRKGDPPTKELLRLTEKTLTMVWHFCEANWHRSLRGKEKAANNLVNSAEVAKLLCQKHSREDLFTDFKELREVALACKVLIQEAKLKLPKDMDAASLLTKTDGIYRFLELQRSKSGQPEGMYDQEKDYGYLGKEVLLLLVIGTQFRLRAIFWCFT